MADGTTHLIAGGLAGLAVATIEDDDKKPALDLLSASTIGCVFGKLPDLLEPAHNPHHRQFFHSIVILSSIGYGMKKVYDWKPDSTIDSIIRLATLCAGAGYISHLLLDGTTPRSLPLIGKFS